MSLFEFDSAYAAQKCEVTLSPACYDTVKVYASDDTEHSLQLTGLQPNDFAVFGHLLHPDELIPVRYLITDYSSRRIATAVNSDHIEIFPEKYITSRLRDTIKLIGEIELSQFDLPLTSDFIFHSGNHTTK